MIPAIPPPAPGESTADARWYLCPTCKDETFVPDYCEAPRCDTCAESMEPTP